MAGRSVLVLTLGATALQKFDASTGGMQLLLSPEALLAAAAVEGVRTALQALRLRSGAELQLATLLQVRDAVLAGLESHCGFVLLCGTDTMEEAAFVLHLVLGTALLRHGRPLCLTGAMLPADQLGGDGAKNLRDAIKVAACPAAPPCTLVVMNDAIHLAQYVCKGDSQLIGAFQSHPGPIGQVRAGLPHFYFAPPAPAVPPALPPAAPAGGGGALGATAADAAGAATSASGGGAEPKSSSSSSGGCGPEWLPHEAFERLPASQLRSRVAIWTLAVSAFLPDALLESGSLDGLVLAGSGTGSLPAAVIDQLSPAWTARLPVVISSRCTTGANHDDWYYRGSRHKYEGRGFVLGQGYEQLNPLQARLLLILRLSAFGHA